MLLMSEANEHGNNVVSKYEIKCMRAHRCQICVRGKYLLFTMLNTLTRPISTPHPSLTTANAPNALTISELRPFHVVTMFRMDRVFRCTWIITNQHNVIQGNKQDSLKSSKDKVIHIIPKKNADVSW